MKGDVPAEVGQVDVQAMLAAADGTEKEESQGGKEVQSLRPQLEDRLGEDNKKDGANYSDGVGSAFLDKVAAEK